MLASAESAHQSSDVFASGVDSTLERELSSAGLTGFASLVKHAGLIPELELRVRFGSALTVFAPTNVALMRADPALLAFLKLPRNAELLRDVLLYHVVARPVSAFAWEGSYETLQGAPIALHVDALAFQVGGTSVKQYRALTLSLTPLSPDEHLSGKAADSTAASAQLSAGDTGSSTVVVHTVNALLLPPSVDELLSLTADQSHYLRSWFCNALSSHSLACAFQISAPSINSPLIHTMTRFALFVAMLPLVLLLLGSSQPAAMLASAESANGSHAFASGVDSTVERELSSAGLTGFSSLLKHAGLMPELELRARFGSALTVFAPTNVALMRADPALLAFLKLPRNAALLRDVLLYHVVARPVSAFAWEGSYETMQGAPIALHVDALAFQVGGTSVKQYRALTLSLTPLASDERISASAGEGADSASASAAAGASAQLIDAAGGSSTVVVHTINALLLPPSVDESLSLTAGDLSIAAGMGEGGRQLAESSGFASASASAPSASPPSSQARDYSMVCDKCAKKLSKVIVPDKWKEGASNTTESGGRKINENKLLSKKKRYTPYASSASFKCIICKQQLHQEGKYCHLCSYKKGVCAMCGKQVLDTSMYKQSAV
ncbi:unnamed protein product [Closterium sp. Naga37s-1]|nr:unnamed protein product [Closterium sp. Naga37s-1]